MHYNNVDIPSETRVGDFTPKPGELILASWRDRFFAWLIDFIIVTIGIEILFYAATFPLWFDSNPDRWNRGGLSVGFVVRSLIFLAYWTYFESTSGQSLGKRIFHLKTVGITGQTVNIRDVLLESFGKSFLLPIDLILGWIFTNDKRQRIFNRVSNTIVVKLGSYAEENSSSAVRYKKDS
jgi:uncharacterized RDD family membrane protein YckC